MSRRDAPLAALRRLNRSAIMDVASEPETSNSTRLVSWIVARKSPRFTAVSNQSLVISSASRRVRPCVKASSIGISANHQRPSRRSLPANLIFTPCKPCAELLAQVVHSLPRAAARTLRVHRLSRRHAGRRASENASRIRAAASQARAASWCFKSVHEHVSRYSCWRGPARHRRDASPRVLAATTHSATTRRAVQM